MADWGVLLLAVTLIWFSTTYEHTPIGITDSAAILWIGILTVVGRFTDLFLTLRRQSRDK